MGEGIKRRTNQGGNMKYVLEYGVRGGAHVDNQILPTCKLAEQFARRLVMVFCNDPFAQGAEERNWIMAKCDYRKYWQNATHYVGISRLDGVMRGSASSALWRKPNAKELTLNQVHTEIY